MLSHSHNQALPLPSQVINQPKKSDSRHEVILFLRNTLPNFLPFSCFCTEEQEISQFLTELKYDGDLNHRETHTMY